ncbi:MAG: hypothetical protein AMJ89_05695 [candidate division Zixibacteria bacterium SM23_73]|nr:MAG: hypothetical protein AMJ89_05695 [candidate division Zixibacteria bacterium SM23_73]
MTHYQKIDLNKIKTYSIKGRKSKTQIKDFAKPPGSKGDVRNLLGGLPKCLKANDFRKLLNSIIKAKRRGKPIIFMFGAHVIKCGVSPVLVDLMQNGFISLLATNGAGAIHDLEIALWGKTSEEVERSIRDGSFGMAKETAEIFNQVSSFAQKESLGLGEAIGKKIWELKAKFRKHSLLANAFKLRIPLTVHVAFGTDIVHQHPNFDASSTGFATHTDFKILANEVSKLNNGGVVLHFGSAVILPEVFLKALSVARNVKGRTRPDEGRIENFTTANFDMIQHYRPNLNLVLRPTQKSGQGFSFSGHHEIMLPLLAWALKAM